MTCGECERRCTEKSFITCMVRSLLVLSIYCAVFTICFVFVCCFQFIFFYLYTVPLLVPVLLCMFDSYRLLGIFVFCEHKAGPPPPPPPSYHLFFALFFFPPWITLKWAVIQIRGGGATLPLPIMSQTQVTKQGWSLFPEASASNLSTIVLWLFVVLYKYQCCFCIFLKESSVIFMQVESPLIVLSDFFFFFYKTNKKAIFVFCFSPCG